jgi:hypothetical protein
MALAGETEGDGAPAPPFAGARARPGLSSPPSSGPAGGALLARARWPRPVRPPPRGPKGPGRRRAFFFDRVEFVVGVGIRSVIGSSLFPG